MAKIKFNVIDKTTIELAQDAKKGDIIDLGEVNELDLNVLNSNLINQINKNADAKAVQLNSKTKKELEDQFKLKIELEKKNVESDFAKQLESERNKIVQLENQIKNFNQQKELELTKAVQKEKDRSQEEKETLQKQINEGLTQINTLNDKLTSQKETFVAKEKSLNEYIDRMKDFKQSLSTKMWGEDLEQYCFNKFEKDLRFGFPKAEFKKDNEVTESGKADFIFKDFTDNGNEYISIIFEMKNENPDSKNKQKNSEFYKKLEKNRNDKNCTYSVLVSTLEMDNTLFDEGIYKVPEYKNMFVIRPNFFAGIIKLLTTLQKNNTSLIDEFEEKKKINIDFTNFEENFLNWKGDVNLNYERASKRYADAIKEIDKTIKHLNEVKENLLSMSKNARIMNDKLQDMTIKKLTKNAPSIRELIENKGKKQ